MKILAVDTSSKVCSISILEDKQVIIEKHNNDEKTHSQKLMPMIDETFKSVGLTLDDIDVMACCQGPGSFTGIRIGISTVKAFADVKNIPIIGVTSLESLAYNIDEDGLIASIIDAKHNNVYFALYERKNSTYKMVEKPVTDNIEDIIETLKKYENDIVIVGDGGIVYKELIASKLTNVTISSLEKSVQTSISVGLSAYDKYNEINYTEEYTLLPIYLKKSEAEINLEKKKQI